jgi:hypothetical protein
LPLFYFCCILPHLPPAYNRVFPGGNRIRPENSFARPCRSPLPLRLQPRRPPGCTRALPRGIDVPRGMWYILYNKLQKYAARLFPPAGRFPPAGAVIRRKEGTL